MHHSLSGEGARNSSFEAVAGCSCISAAVCLPSRPCGGHAWYALSGSSCPRRRAKRAAAVAVAGRAACASRARAARRRRWIPAGEQELWGTRR
eukprot:7245509-Prymnesium_polylepis.1